MFTGRGGHAGAGGAGGANDSLKAIWKPLSDEVSDIRQAEGEDFFKVFRLHGQKMTEKAFMHLPAVTEERDMVICLGFIFCIAIKLISVC